MGRIDPFGGKVKSRRLSMGGRSPQSDLRHLEVGHQRSGKEAAAEDEVVVLVSETTQAQAGPYFVFVPCPSVRLDGAGLIARLIRRIPRDETLPGS